MKQSSPLCPEPAVNEILIFVNELLMPRVSNNLLCIFNSEKRNTPVCGLFGCP